MINEKGFASVMVLFIALILIMGLASAVSNSTNNNTNQQYQDPTIQVDVTSTNPNTQTPIGMSVQTACAYMGGSWYQNTNTCAGNIDTNKCTLYGGKINGCDSSCRYAKSRICYTTCEITCTFN